MKKRLINIANILEMAYNTHIYVEKEEYSMSDYREFVVGGNEY